MPGRTRRTKKNAAEFDRWAEIAAWVKLIKLWRKAERHPSSTGYFWVPLGMAVSPISGTVTMQYSWGLCGAIAKVIPHRVALPMLVKIEAERLKRAADRQYVWGFSARSQAARIRFCQRQIQLLSKGSKEGSCQTAPLRSRRGSK